jgi:hypothetical protein
MGDFDWLAIPTDNTTAIVAVANIRMLFMSLSAADPEEVRSTLADLKGPPYPART